MKKFFDKALARFELFLEVNRDRWWIGIFLNAFILPASIIIFLIFKAFEYLFL